MKKLKTFLLVLVVFSLLPFQCWSESSSGSDTITLTVEQWEKFKQNLAKLQVNVNNLETINLNQALSLQTVNQSLQSATTSLQKLKEETQNQKIEIGIVCFSVGAVLGVISGIIITNYIKG